MNSGRSGVRVCLFGAIHVERSGIAVNIGSAAQRRILARLALSPGQVVSQDALIDVLWPDDPPRTAKASVQNHLSGLRSHLPSAVIETVAPGYVLRLASDDIDVHRFETLIGLALSNPPVDVEAARSQLLDLDEALALATGDPFAEVAQEDWARPSAVRLLELHAVTRERRVDALLTLLRVDDAVAAAETLCESEPLRERAHALLMQSLARQGRAAEALRVHDGFRKRLISDTGLEPSAALPR